MGNWRPSSLRRGCGGQLRSARHSAPYTPVVMVGVVRRVGELPVFVVSTLPLITSGVTRNRLTECSSIWVIVDLQLSDLIRKGGNS